MIYPLIHAYLRALPLQASFAPVLGLVEGIAESTASLTRVGSGLLSDRLRKRKGFAILGYGVSLLAKVLLLIPAWLGVLAGRFADRVGKGIRTAPRDALVAGSVDETARGRAYGVQRSLDFIGGVVGVLFAILLVGRLEIRPEAISLPAFRWVFLLALIPAAIGLLFLALCKGIVPADSGKRYGGTIGALLKPRPLRIFYLSQIIFALGNSSNQFLLLRTADLLGGLQTALIVYLLFKLVSSLLCAPIGILSDRIGQRRILIAGYVLYAVVYVGFGFAESIPNGWLWPLWLLYGVYYAMTDGVEKALVSKIAPKESAATAQAVHQTLNSIGLLAASVIAGLLLTVHPAAPYLLGGGLAALSSLVLIVFRPAR